MLAMDAGNSSGNVHSCLSVSKAISLLIYPQAIGQQRDVIDNHYSFRGFESPPTSQRGVVKVLPTSPLKHAEFPRTPRNRLV
jgi:hypothetical protein